MVYESKNYKIQKVRLTAEESRGYHILADLYDKDGGYYRTAVVGKCFNFHDAKQFILEKGDRQ